MVFNDKGVELYTRSVEHMSTRALEDMLTSFGFHRNDTAPATGDVSGSPLRGEARTAVAMRARLRAAAAAAAAAEEAERKAAAEAAAREKEAQKRAQEEASKQAAQKAVAAGQGNRTVNQSLDVAAAVSRRNAA